MNLDPINHPADSGQISIDDLQSKVIEGDAKSAAKLCGIYRKKNEPENLYKWAGKGAELGDPESLYWLSLFEFEKNFDKAFDRLETAACRGHIPSMVMMGNLYREGYFQTDQKIKTITLCLFRDQNKALHWYSKASHLGSLFATVCIGDLYYENRIYKSAIKWYKQAGDYGPALKKIGDLYREGLGVAKNPEAARHHYEKAARLGDQKASEELDKMDQPYIVQLFWSFFD